MSRKLLYLINPISGTQGKAPLRALIEARTKAAGFDFAIYPSVANGDYSFLDPIIKEEGFTDVIIAGGDGTINQAVNALRAQPVRFGIIPCGSGNGLAFSAGIPKNPEKALDIVFRGEARDTDAFMINDRFACMLVGLGLDAQVAHDFANDPRRGLATYVKKTIAGFLSAKTYPFTLSVSGRDIVTDAYFVSVANSNQFGNHFTIAPEASLTDGLLDIVVMTKQNKLSVLLQAIRQVGGYNKLQRLEVINEKANVLYFQATNLTINNPGGAPVHIDGDPVETIRTMEIRLLPGAFRLIHG